MLKRIAIGTAVLAMALAVQPTKAQAQDRYYGNPYDYRFQNGERYEHDRFVDHERREAFERRERWERERAFREQERRERLRRLYAERYGYRDGYRGW